MLSSFTLLSSTLCVHAFDAFVFTSPCRSISPPSSRPLFSLYTYSRVFLTLVLADLKLKPCII